MRIIRRETIESLNETIHQGEYVEGEVGEAMVVKWKCTLNKDGSITFRTMRTIMELVDDLGS